MIRLIFTMISLSFLISCLSKKASNQFGENKKIYFPCKECRDYILENLRPQMISCGSFRTYEQGNILEKREDCKLDREKVKMFGSCLLGMAEEDIHHLFGKKSIYSCIIKSRPNIASVYIRFKYNKTNKRLIEIDHLNVNETINRTTPCLDCENLYTKIRNCLLYTSPSPRDKRQSRMPSSA